MIYQCKNAAKDYFIINSTYLLYYQPFKSCPHRRRRSHKGKLCLPAG